jgi:thiamine-phosphate pyrophosphorylase
MKFPPVFGLYAILSDPLVGYDDLARLLVDHGTAFIQLRMKDAPAETVLRVARSLRRIIPENGPTKFIINDDPEICLAAGADGVHVGQSDMPYSQTRRIVGDGAVIGISTHTPQQTIDACALGPDYIGVGPVYATPTKKKPDPAIGIDGMRIMLARATVPAVAIGGIDLINLRDVLAAGARNFCMVRQINRSQQPRQVLKDMRAILREFGM